MEKLSNSEVMNAIYNDIWDDLKELGAEEVKHYMCSFPRELDYNLVNYGSMRVYYYDIREMYANAGMKRVTETYKRDNAVRGWSKGDYKISDDELWRMYQRDTRHVAQMFIERQ